MRVLYLAVIGPVVISGMAACHLKGQSKPKFSSDDALAIIRIQQDINRIQAKLTADVDAIKKKANDEAAPFFKEGQDIQSRVCKDNGFGPDCELDPLKQTVKAKPVAKPEAPPTVPPTPAK